MAQRLARFVRPVLINGTAGAVTLVHGRPFSVMAFTVRGGKVAAIDVLYDPQRLADLDLDDLDDARPGARACLTKVQDRVRL
jgi:hypothetical protein